MKTLLIVFHSLTGGTRQMSQAAAEGASSEPEINVRLLHASECSANDVLAAHGYIFSTPENLGSMSGMMKDFFDRTYYAVLDCAVGRPYAALICAGSDGENAARQIDRIITGWRLKRVANPLIVCTFAQTPEEILRNKEISADDLNRCRELGATLAAVLAFGLF